MEELIVQKKEIEFQNVYSPGTLLGVFANAIRSPADGRLILLKGSYYQGANSREYNGYYYDDIKSENENKWVRSRISTFLRSKLESNTTYIFKGYIEKKIGTHSIDLLFIIDDVLQKEEKQISEEEVKKFELIQQKMAKGFRDFEALVKENIYKGTVLKIANLYGNSAIVHKDFEKGIAEAMVKFSITERRCNFNSKNEIAQALKELGSSNFDVIALVRGGGDSGLEIFNEHEIGKEAIHLKPLLVTALGHTVNETLLDKLSDKKFALPHDYGNTLKVWVDQAIDDQSRSKSVFIEQVKKDLAKTFTEQITLLQNQLQLKNQEFSKLSQSLSVHMERMSALNKRILFYVIGSVIAGLIIGYFLK